MQYYAEASTTAACEQEQDFGRTKEGQSLQPDERQLLRQGGVDEWALKRQTGCLWKDLEGAYCADRKAWGQMVRLCHAVKCNGRA